MRRNGKIYPYIVVLKNTQAGRIRLVGTLMSLFGILMLIYRGLSTEGSQLNLVFAVAALILTVWNIYSSRKGKKVWYRYPLLVIALGLIAIQPFHWAGLLYIAMTLLEKPASKPVEIGFAEEHVRFNGLTNKDHAWTEFQDVILKDGLLTMDFKNNKVLQLDTDDEEDDDYDADEDEFNEWVGKQLSSSSS